MKVTDRRKVRTWRAGLAVAAGGMVAATISATSIVPADFLSDRLTTLETPAGEAVRGPSSEQRIQAELHFRRSFGLNDDPTYVRRLHETPGVEYDTNYGAVLTDEERGQLQRQFAIQDGLNVVKAYAEAQPDFAGVHIDHAQGGLIYVAFTGRLDTHLTALRSVFPQPDAIRVVGAEFTLADLERVHTAINERFRGLRSEGLPILDVTTDVRDNEVEVGLARVEDDTLERLQTEFGPAVSVEETRPPEQASRSNAYPPMRGGLEITRPSDRVGYITRCTSAFGVRKTEAIQTIFGPQYVRSDFVLSAGHCDGPNSTGNTWSSSLVAVGRTAYNSYRDNSTADALLIELRPSDLTNTVYMSDTNTRFIYSAEGYNADTVGAGVCISAISTDVRCGSIDSVNTTAYYSDDDVQLLQQRLANFPAINGDSGGPVFWSTMAKGVISGTRNDSQMIYSHVWQATFNHSASLYTGS